jgi:hypothetical protein
MADAAPPASGAGEPAPIAPPSTKRYRRADLEDEEQAKLEGSEEEE